MEMRNEDVVQSSGTTRQLTHRILRTLSAVNQEEFLAHFQNLSAWIVLNSGHRTPAS